ncbi:MAG: hypothetical protein L0H93_13665 [Nocardioides sp.]|nr:hypothetical protein [Nocardioides sp.]
MHSRSATPSRTRTVASVLGPALGCLLLAGTLGACSDSPEPPAESAYEATPLSDFDASTVTLDRTDFCGDLSEDAVKYTVGKVAATKHYGNGDPVKLTKGVKDVAHEYNCTFVGKSGVTARAWVFVPQVTTQRAKELVTAAGKVKGCTLVDGKGFGTPGTGRVCRTDKETEVAYSGLFVDTWLTCSLTRPDPKADQADMLRETGEWCVAAAEAAAN